MKIAFDGKRAFHNFRGLGHFSRTLIDGLFKFYPENEYTLYTPSVADQRAIDWARRHPSIVVKGPEGFFENLFSGFWRTFFLSSLLQRESYDIYHGLSHELPVGIEKVDLKKIVTIHDLLFMKFPEYYPWIDRQIYKRKFIHSCKNADIVIAICEQTKRDIVELLNVPAEKVRVVYQSCDSGYYRQLSSTLKNEIVKKYKLPDDYILTVGALVPNKNGLALIKAFSRLYDKISLVFVGKGERYKKVLVQEADKLKVKDRILFLEDVPFSDLPGIYQNATIFAFPSFYEGFGIPIIEALYSGVPVVTSKGSCFPESGGSHSIYIDPNSCEEIADAFNRLLVNSELRYQMSLKGLEFVQKFHWKNTSNNLMKIYSELG